MRTLRLAAAPTQLPDASRAAHAIKLARRQPAKAAVKRGFAPAKPSGAREIREPPKAWLKIDKTLAVKTSDFVARTPPIRKSVAFSD